MTENFTGCGNHSRTISVKSEIAKCFECKENKPVLIFDSSNEEYTPMRFCIDCLRKFSEGYVSKSSWEDDYSDF